MKRKIVILLLAFALCAPGGVPVLATYMEDFIDNDLYTESTFAEVDARFNAGENFIVLATIESCGNTRTRRTVLDKWMTKYQIPVYGIDLDTNASQPPWTMNYFGAGRGHTPYITVVKNRTALTFTADDSMIELQRYIVWNLGMGDDIDEAEFGFEYLNRMIYGAYASDRKTLENYLAPSVDIQSDNAQIRERAKDIIDASGAKSDYEKAKAIHDWVAGNIHYDWGAYYETSVGATDAVMTYMWRSSVCSGYANLTAALCRAAQIPARVVSGYGAGVDTEESFTVLFDAYQAYRRDGDLDKFKQLADRYVNHAWNEIYADGRWILVDATWDSSSEVYDNPDDVSLISYRAVDQEYFDTDISEFSLTHLFWEDVSLPPVAATPLTPVAALTASPISAAVFINGVNTPFDAYNIEGNNYFKLRDLAFVLNGTETQFSVSYDGANNAISLTSGQPYTAVGGEMTGKGAGNKTPSPTTSKIYLGGKEVSFTAYNIEENNYFKLRDVGEAFDFGVDWDASQNAIVIDTGKSYTAD
jgi:hypothetical protein